MKLYTYSLYLSIYVISLNGYTKIQMIAMNHTDRILNFLIVSRCSSIQSLRNPCSGERKQKA